MKRIAAALLALAGGPAAAGDPPAEKPLPTPLTRPAMKQALEDLKHRTPRIPLPPLTDAEKELGERERGYESRLRSVYMPRMGDGRGGFGFGGRGDPDPDLTLSNAFKVKLFWLVSRTNNCLY